MSSDEGMENRGWFERSESFSKGPVEGPDGGAQSRNRCREP